MKPFRELTHRGRIGRMRALARTALRERGLRFDRLDFLRWSENTVFRVRSGNASWLLRVHRPEYHRDVEIRSELTWLTSLRTDHGLRVPRPVGDLQIVDAPGVGPRRVALFQWIDGRFSDRFRRPRMAAVGRLMARLHEAAATWQPPKGFSRPSLDVDGLAGDTPVMGGGMHLAPDQHRALFEEARERARAAAGEVWAPGVNVHLIHADLDHTNYLFDSASRVVPIDFDDCGFGHALYDMAVTLGAPSDRPNGPELMAAFLRGYREIRPCSDDLLAYLPAFRILRRLALLFWWYGRRDHPGLSERARRQTPGVVERLRREMVLLPT